MKENQVIEWKQSWRDEYLKWICGFANAQGGTLVIGKNDKGEMLGVANAPKLLEDIPNKVRDILGMVVPVNLHSDGGKDWLEIVVMNPYSHPSAPNIPKQEIANAIVAVTAFLDLVAKK